MRLLGADVRLCQDYDAAEAAARAWARAHAIPFLSPYAHPDVIAGAGTVALEILAERPDVRTIVVALGGGGLAAGCGIAARGIAGQARVVAAEVEASSPFTASLAAGRITTVQVQPTLADGLAGNLDPETPTFGLVQRIVEQVVVVQEEALRSAVRDVHRHDGLVIEGAAAAAVAAITSGRARPSGPAAVVLSGGNIDPEVLAELTATGC